MFAYLNKIKHFFCRVKLWSSNKNTVDVKLQTEKKYRLDLMMSIEDILHLFLLIFSLSLSSFFCEKCIINKQILVAVDFFLKISNTQSIIKSNQINVHDYNIKGCRVLASTIIHICRRKIWPEPQTPIRRK